MTTVFAKTALLPDGWAENVLIAVDGAGFITDVKPESAPPPRGEWLAGPVLPGMPNVHSHAFQRAMAGLAERVTGDKDSFWTWREVMYRFAQNITPEDLQTIALQLYIEMLKSGFTNVAEFHYLHHQPDGTPYEDRALMSRVLATAAGEAGIGMTLLPVLYAHSGFGGAPPVEGQKRFLNTAEEIAEIIAGLEKETRSNPQITTGLAHHSLRAVTPDMLREATEYLHDIDAAAPVHIHIAEQQAEVDACLAWSGKRPVAFLFENAEINENWCLVHATHMDESETAALAQSGAVAGLCPTTEANLGDGLFPLSAFLEAGGRIAVGSDSHISVSAAEELRWLEYGQRLFYQARAVTRIADSPSSGRALYRRCLEGGVQVSGRKTGKIAEGFRADLVVLDGEAPDIAEKHGDDILDAYIFGGHENTVRDVMCGGKWAVREKRHAQEEDSRRAYRAVLRKLCAL